MNGSRTTYTTPHKKKLWNSLELSNTLIVENVTVDHTGEYTCTASSGLMKKSASAFVKVYSRYLRDLRTRGSLLKTAVGVAIYFKSIDDDDDLHQYVVIFQKSLLLI